MATQPTSWWKNTTQRLGFGESPASRSIMEPPLPPLRTPNWSDESLPEEPVPDWTAEQLSRALDLVDSPRPEEALTALQAARHILLCLGIDIIEVARRLAEVQTPHEDESDELRKKLETFENLIFDLRNDVRGLRAENERLRRETDKPSTEKDENP